MSEHPGHTPAPEDAAPETSASSKKHKRHLVKPTWLRRILKTLLAIFVVILLLPALIYVPFIQDWLTDAACGMVSRATGMTVKIDRFRLRWPLDVQLDGVLVLTQTGDTMAQARSLVADVKMMPLLRLDAQINRVRLLDGKYIMASEDSSMNMRMQAGLLEFTQGSALDLRNSRIDLRRPVLRNAEISLDIDVWKQKPDSVSAPTEWVITADRLGLDNVRFRMSMLPTIKDLDVTIGRGSLAGTVIDLKNHDIRANSADIAGGRARYVVPTPKYIETHPLPVDTVSPPSIPYTIKIGKAHMAFDNALYGVDGAVPQPGFDPSHIEASEVDLRLENFYNRASTVRLPFTSMKAKERSGISVTSGSGEIAIDSLGLRFTGLDISTANSHLEGDAYISYGMMALDPHAPMTLDASGSLGWDDLYAYMPSLKPLLSKIPNRDPIVFSASATGSVSALDIEHFSLGIRRFLSLKAKGTVTNPADFKRMRASADIDGSLQDAGVVNRMFGRELAAMGVKIPRFSIKGHIGVEGQRYRTDLSIRSSAGDASLDGSLALGAERYDVEATLRGFDISAIMPSLGIGAVSGSLSANGAGFDPMKPGAHTSVEAHMRTLVYGGHDMAPLTLSAKLAGKKFDIDLQGTNPDLDLSLLARGSMSGSVIDADMTADMRHVDLHRLGFMTMPCAGSARFDVSGSADIQTYHCDLEAGLHDLDWTYGTESYVIPDAFDARLVSTASSTTLGIYGEGLDLDFSAAAPLERLMADLPDIASMVAGQVDDRNLDMTVISDKMPSFTLGMDVAGDGLVSHFTDGTGYRFGTLHLTLANDSAISGDMRLTEAGNSSLTLDTVTLGLTQRGRMLDYRLHVGNKPSNLPEFAAVDITGYAGSNRASAYMRQRDSKGKEGYRLGLTAAFIDSTVNVHLTPLDATIAYKPWSINDDNYVQIGPGNRVQADLTASCGESSVRLATPERTDSLQALQVRIQNLHIEDFLQMNVMAPPVSGAVNSDLTLVYRGNSITGSGSLGVKDLAYDRRRIGDLDFDIKAGMGFSGNSGGKIGMLVDGKEVAVLRGYMITDSVAASRRADGTPTAFDLELKGFPLSIANAFLSPEYMQLTGALEGKMRMTGELSAPVLNGSVTCDSAGVRIPAAASTIYFGQDRPIIVDNNILRFDKFGIYGVNRQPVTVDGTVDARDLSDMMIDLALAGKNVALVDNKRRGGEIYGKLLVDIDASARGHLSRLDIGAAISVLPATDIYYTYISTSSQISQGNTTDVVRFVQFSDSTLVAKTDSTAKTAPMNMSINASLDIITGAKATVNLSGNGTDKVTLTPYGNLSYTQNYMGDMRLNGSLFLGKGFVRYSVPMIGEKTFDFDEGSYVNWSGDLMNPALHIYATDRIKANVQQEGMNSRLIYFDVGLSVLGNLAAPKVTFGLSTDDDMTVQNELLSMSADQRSASAIHLLLYNTYTGPGVKADANLSNPLYSFLEGQLNSWAAKNIRGVDLSFGIDQYKQTVDGQKDNTTSYSYQVSKSLFDNKFKIIVGGNYSTDAQADENFAQNLISDISFEYSLKQTSNLDMYLRLFRHTGFESILEGEVTETGVGFVMRRKMSDLRSLFRFGRKRKRQAETPADSMPQSPDSAPQAALRQTPALVPLSQDSIINDEASPEK